MAGSRLLRRDRRIGHELNVRVGDLRELVVDDDRAVHLRELVQMLRREGQVEPDAARVEKGERGRIADHDQCALVRADDVVDPLAKLGAGCDPLDRPEQARIAARVVLGGRAGEAEAATGLFVRPVVHRAPP